MIITMAIPIHTGSSMAFKSNAGRVLHLSCLLLQILLMAHYTSDLISGLAMGPPLPSVNTIDDINRNSKLTLGWRKGSSLGEIFKVKMERSSSALCVAVDERGGFNGGCGVCGVGVNIISVLCQHQ